MARTYFIGGIATDKRLYSHQLQHIPDSVYLPFPTPEPSDTMASYVLKFLPLIDTTRPFNLVGCSMGGIMTMELLQHIRPEKAVLISSVKNRSEMPWRLRQLKTTRLHKLLPGWLFIRSIAWGSPFIKELKAVDGLEKVVADMARANAPAFLSWCVHAIVCWEGPAAYREDIIHIHGDKDQMFPIKNLRRVIPVKNGSHKMLLSDPPYFTRFLSENL